MSRNQKIIIGVVALICVIGIVSALNFFSRQGARTRVGETRIQTPVTQIGTPDPAVSEKAVDGSVVGTLAPAQPPAAPQPAASESATVTSKADVEKMLQDTESDFRSIDTDVSAQ